MHYEPCSRALEIQLKYVHTGRGRITDNPNMKNVHIIFSVWVHRIEFIITAIQRIDREEDTSLSRRNLRIIYICMYCPLNKLFNYEQCVLCDKL